MTFLRKTLGKVWMPHTCYNRLNIAAFCCYGSHISQIEAYPIFRTAFINLYTLRPLTALHGDQMDKILLYMAGEEATIRGLYAKARMLKQQTLRNVVPSSVDFIGTSIQTQGPVPWPLDSPPPLRRDNRPIAPLPMVPAVLCLTSECPQDADSQDACQATKGIQIGARIVDLAYSKYYASVGDGAEGPLVGK